LRKRETNKQEIEARNKQREEATSKPSKTLIPTSKGLGDTLYLTNPHVLAQKGKKEEEKARSKYSLTTPRLKCGRRPYHSSYNYEPL
jgi:hypothetical protein